MTPTPPGDPRQILSPARPGATAGLNSSRRQVADGPVPDSAVAGRQVVTGEVLPADEYWETGDIVLAADRGLWCRAREEDIAQGWPWAYAGSTAPLRDGRDAPEGGVEEHVPVRPLTLLLRDGRPALTAASTAASPTVATVALGAEEERTVTDDQNDRLRAALHDQARRARRIPPRLTPEVAAAEFERLLADYFAATPEVIAVALIRRADQWDEIDAVYAALRRFYPPVLPTTRTGHASAPTGPGPERGGDDGRQ